ncbi:MAG: PD40 domain-containing protein [Candidatus Promineofilum sp.]|nr:PD40 domain-containing protein [Promineifilum sp.]
MTISQGTARTLFLLSLLLVLLLPTACAPTAMEPAAQEAGTTLPTEPPALAVVTPAAGSPETLPAPSPTILIYAYPGAPGHTPTPDVYPWPTQTPGPTDPPEPTEEPTETEIPFPTLPPTPVVTLVPTIAPPFLPVPDGTTAQPFTVYWRDGDVIRSLSTAEGAEPQVFLDPAAEFGLYLTPIEAYFRTWGAMSPDGRSLALILTEEPQPLDYSMVAHPIAIYILDMKSRTLRLLLEDGGELVWSPDSRRLAYHYGHTLYVTDVATGETTGVYTAEAEYDEAYPRDYSWSPDGRYLALIKEDPFTGRSLLVVDTQGEAAPVTLVSREPYSVGDTQWSPTGNQITYVFPGEGRLGRYDLWITNPDGADKRQLTYDLDVASVQWSADGQWLALYALAAYEPEPANWDLWLLDPRAGDLRRLTFTQATDESMTSPEWSPDGTQLVFYRHPPGLTPMELWVKSLLDGTERRLVSPAMIKEIGLVVGP